MLFDFFLAEPEKACGIVVKDVTLLLRAQERRIFDGLDSDLDGSRRREVWDDVSAPFQVEAGW
jgi:hypothetical protein